MFEAILARIARRFDAAGLPYMVIGGRAVLLYGEPPPSRGNDVTIGASLDLLPGVLEQVLAMGMLQQVDSNR